jgi:hypothetical protein
MHVPSYPRVLALLAVLAGFAGGAQAVEFDANVKAPLVKEPTALRSQAQSYVAKFAALKDAGPQDLISNRALAAERFDLVWQIQQAIDVRRPLGDLSAVGLEAQADGSYRVDYNANPQWNEPGRFPSIWLQGVDWDGLGTELIERGFRPEDVVKLRDYVATHDASQTAQQRSLKLAISFSKVVKKYDLIKRPVDDGQVLSYLYQLGKIQADATREWANGLLESLDAQRGRILLAYFSEMTATSIWAPSDQRAGIDELLRRMRLPNFEQLATAEVAGGQS